MFAQNLKVFFRNELFTKSRTFKNYASRTFASSLKIYDENIVKSPHPPLSYPDLSIDQYIWRDMEFWKNKTAIVSLNLKNVKETQT